MTKQDLPSNGSPSEGVEGSETRSGYVAIVGRPNVGKSTLLNHLLGQKISITSRKPQTTRHRILGIKTQGELQIVYVDTPGVHAIEKNAMNRYMNRAATTAIRDVDAVILVVDGLLWTEGDQLVLEKLSSVKAPVMLVVNKVDQITRKEDLLPHIQMLSEKRDFKAIVPCAAMNAYRIDEVEREVIDCMPLGPHFFEPDQITDRNQRFLVAEMVREKIMRQLGQEVPYAMTVEIEQFKWVRGVWHIHALILVERAGQKAILIGKGGKRLRTIGAEARKDMERMLDAKVMLQTWVKVKSGWADDERALRSLGYTDDE